MGRLPPARAGPAHLQVPQPSPDPTPCGLRQVLCTQSSQGMRSLGWPWERVCQEELKVDWVEPRQLVEVLGVPQPHPPAMQLRTTREPREALQAQSTLLSSWVQAGTHRVSLGLWALSLHPVLTKMRGGAVAILPVERRKWGICWSVWMTLQRLGLFL